MFDEQKLRAFYKELMSPVTDALVDNCMTLAQGVLKQCSPDMDEAEVMKQIQPLIKGQADDMIRAIKSIDISKVIKEANNG